MRGPVITHGLLALCHAYVGKKKIVVIPHSTKPTLLRTPQGYLTDGIECKSLMSEHPIVGVLDG